MKSKPMTHGKHICNQLKEVRKRIAEENGIPLEMRECHYKGECRGTCPRCEAEVRYLESALVERLRLGKVATVAGLALGLALPGVATAQDTISLNEVNITDEKPKVIEIIPENGTAGIIADEPQEIQHTPEDTLPTVLPELPPVRWEGERAVELIRIKGTVVDERTGATMPLTPVLFTNGNDSIWVYTDNNGNFVAEVRKGHYTITVSAVGYHKYVLRRREKFTENCTLPTIELQSGPIGTRGDI